MMSSCMIVVVYKKFEKMQARQLNAKETTLSLPKKILSPKIRRHYCNPISSGVWNLLLRMSTTS